MEISELLEMLSNKTRLESISNVVHDARLAFNQRTQAEDVPTPEVFTNRAQHALIIKELMDEQVSAD